jgi:hypothetical protein
MPTKNIDYGYPITKMLQNPPFIQQFLVKYRQKGGDNVELVY